ncbi:DRBM domain-containing protein [Prescottella defluvii]|uniref:hypothetical protein n=1 Tax=Prescottella defluvii TaxID=1323361 RepID=UPI0004F39D82|nr:hypothetical protein [Prescottella defluvii]
MRDTRLVQTAVLKHAGSDRPVLMPMERWDALALRAAIAQQSLWCGHLLGGCGRQLSTRIGRERVPHFAHFPNADGTLTSCHRLHTDGSSADHLFINHGVRDLLHRHGRRPGRTRFDGEFDSGGGCHWITIDLADAQGVVVVALRGADLSDWEEREDRLRASSPWISWLFGPGLRAPQRLLHRDGFAVHLMFDERAPGRPMKLGTQLLAAPTEWIDLHDARFGDDGLVTPAAADARCARRDAAIPPTPMLVPEPQLPAPTAMPVPSPVPGARMVPLDNGIEMSLPELRVLLGRLAQRSGFAGDADKSRAIAEHARSLDDAPVDSIAFPLWLQRAIAAELGVPDNRADDGAQPADPGPSVDAIPLHDDVIAVLRDVGWDPTTDLKRMRWLKLASVHSSYLYENRTIEADPKVLHMLAEVGKRWLGLAILDSFALEYRAKSAGEQSQVLANLRAAFFDALGTRSRLARHHILGRGEALAMQNDAYRAKSRVEVDGVLQICGAVALWGGVDSLYELARRWYPEVKEAVRGGDGAAESVDWKTALIQLDASIAFDGTASGPDHDKTFIVTATDRRGRTGRGVGPSRKRAERAACEDFVRTHSPQEAARLISSVRTSFRYEPQVRPQPLPRDQYAAHWRAVGAARRMFDLPPDADTYLAQALIHSSWVYENRAVASLARQHDNAVLAHHGSAVVDALTAHRRAEQVLSSSLTPTADDARVTTPPEKVWRDAFTATALAPGLLLGKGEGQHPARSYANAMQAMLAVAWRFRGRDLLRAMPTELIDHVNQASDGSTDHYTRLVESCRPFGIEFEETYEATGPDHQRTFTCTLTMTSQEGRHAITGAPTMSKSLAKQGVAGRVLAIVETTSSCDDWQVDANDPALAEFLLRSQLTRCAQVKQSHLTRLVSRGALGVTYLLTEDIPAFAAWAQQVEELTGGIDGDEAEELRRFYVRCLRDVGSAPASKKPLRAALDHLRRQARGLGLSDSDRRLLDVAHRVIRTSLEHDDRDHAATAETVQWIVVAADRRGGRARVRQESDEFTVVVSDVDPSELSDPFVSLMRAQFPTLTVEVGESAITIGCEPVPAARSILQAGALASADTSMPVRRSVYDAVLSLHDAVGAGDPESIEAAVDELDRLLGS